MTAVTQVHLRPDGALFVACDQCEFGEVVPIEQIRRVFGDMDTGNAVLRVVWHVQHEHNGIPAEELSCR